MTDHPVRGRLNAWLLYALDGYMDRRYGALKRSLLGTVPPRVVELGPGAGANLRYYPPGTHLVAVEPNARMHGRLRRHADRHGIRLELIADGAETLRLEAGSVDLVYTTLVLCSVSDPLAVVREARRALRPGGRFVCIEHVAAPRGSPVLPLQRLIARPWRWLFEGCRLLNDTEAVLRGAGFSEVSVRPLVIPTVFLPIRHQIAVVGTV